MNDLVSHAADMGLNLVQALLGVGLVIALVKVVFGHRDGCSHVVGIVFAAIVIELWRAGELASVFQSIVQQLISGSNAPPAF